MTLRSPLRLVSGTSRRTTRRQTDPLRRRGMIGRRSELGSLGYRERGDSFCVDTLYSYLLFALPWLGLFVFVLWEVALVWFGICQIFI